MKFIKKPSLTAKQTIGSLIIKGSSLVLSLISSVILARLLGPENLGVYAFCVGIITILVIPSSFGLQHLLLREIPKKMVHKNFEELKGLLLRGSHYSFLVSALLGLMIIIFAWFSGNSNDYQLALYWSALFLPSLAMLQITSSTLKGFGVIVFGQFIELTAKPFIFLSLICCLCFLTKERILSYQAIYMQALATIVACGIGVYFIIKKDLLKFFPKVEATFNKKLLRSALVLMMYTGVSALNNNISILMLGSFNMQKEIGFFSVAQRGADVVAFALIAVSNALSPKISHYYSQNKMNILQDMINKSSIIIIFYTIPCAFVLILFSNTIIKFVFGAEYISSVIPFCIICIGQLFNAVFGYCGLTLNMIGNEILTMICISIGFILNLLLNLFLIPKYGINGAAVASAVGLISWKLIASLILDKQFGIRFGPFLVKELFNKDDA